MTLCTYKGNELPCIAEAKPDSSRHYCGPHEQMLAHDYARAYRRKAKASVPSADAWAARHGLDVDVLKAAGEKMTDHTKPMTVRTVADVDSL